MDSKQEGRREMFNKLIGLGILSTASLENKEARVFDIRFIQQRSLEEAGKELGLTRERVRQIQTNAIGKLKMSK